MEILTKQDKIDKLYEIMANFNLVDWTRLKVTEANWPIEWVVYHWKALWLDGEVTDADYLLGNQPQSIMWAPLMIGDVLNYVLKDVKRDLNERMFYEDDVIRLIKMWENLDAPIEYQSEACIDFVLFYTKGAWLK